MVAVTCSFPSDIDAAFRSLTDEWSASSKVSRLWNRDSSLWTSAAAPWTEDKWMGWLDIVEKQSAKTAEFAKLAEIAKASGCSDIVLLGMGGSSLCPEVLAVSFGHQKGFPTFHILDSTDPAQVRAIKKLADPAKTLYVVASKSGSTLEPNIFKDYFFDKAGKDGGRFIAITDPGSGLEAVANQDAFKKICEGVPSVGGRYSALSAFGMAPSALMGLDTPHLLARASEMVTACREPNASENPGVALGLALGAAWQKKRDKVTLIVSPAIHDLGAWLEQLVAESTGKNQQALIPVDREPIAAPGVYGNDRIFVYIRFSHAPDARQEAAVTALEAAGHPVIHLNVADKYDLGAEFFRWEIATAVAGSVLGINPFDQPDVEASKIETRKLTDEYKRTGKLPEEKPILESDGLKFFAGPNFAPKLSGTSASEMLRSLLSGVKSPDYFALLAYIHMTPEHEAALTAMRVAVRDSKKVATCLGFGPRFLHSTGQAYKGGPNTGVFLQITCDDAEELPIPGGPLTFSVVKAAQARGDFGVLTVRDRRALRVHLPADVKGGLAALDKAISEAIA